jgi:hypothetical protein
LVLERIAETLRKSILTSYICSLAEECDAGVMDVRIIPSGNDPGIFDIHVITRHVQPEPSVNHIRLRGRKSGSTLASIRQVGSQLLLLHDANEVRDLKFVDDAEFIVLVSGKHASRIDSWAIDGSRKDWITRHTFDHNVPAQERPAKLEVNGRKGRRVVCVLDEQRTRYTIFDLDDRAVDDADRSRGSAAEDGSDQIMTG